MWSIILGHIHEVGHTDHGVRMLVFPDNLETRDLSYSLLTTIQLHHLVTFAPGTRHDFALLISFRKSIAMHW